MHCALKTGYTVTSLSINNLAGYKSVTTRLHGYIVVNQQLNRENSLATPLSSSGRRPLPNSNRIVPAKAYPIANECITRLIAAQYVLRNRPDEILFKKDRFALARIGVTHIPLFYHSSG